MNPFRLLLLAASRRHNHNQLVAALQNARSALAGSEEAREDGTRAYAALQTDMWRQERACTRLAEVAQDRLREANGVIEALEARLKAADENNNTLKLNLANAREENGRLGRLVDLRDGELVDALALAMRLDGDNAQLAGQLADAKAQLSSYTLAEAIDDETRAKRHMDVGDGE